MLVRRARRRMVRAPTAAKARLMGSQRRERAGRFSDIPSPFRNRAPSTSRSVACSRVTVRALELVAQGPGSLVDGVDEVSVTAEAIGLSDSPIVRSDLDRLLEVLEGEGHGVTEAVIGLGEPLGQPSRGQVTLDAGGGVPVPALEPGVVLLVHDVTVHAGARVGRQIREALGVSEGEGAHAGEHPDEAGKDQRQSRAAHHSPPVNAAEHSASNASEPHMHLLTVLAKPHEDSGQRLETPARSCNRWPPRVGTARRLGAAWNYGQVSPVPRAAPGRRATVHSKTRKMFGEISGFLLDFTRLVGEDCADHGVPLKFAHRIAVPADQKNGHFWLFGSPGVGYTPRSMRASRFGVRALFIFAVVASAAGCKEAPKAAVRPPEPVKVAPVVQRDVPIYGEWVGTTLGYVTAQIRAHVQGYLISQNYKEGTVVKQGDLLFQIDPRQFQNAVNQSKAALRTAESHLEQAKA